MDSSNNSRKSAAAVFVARAGVLLLYLAACATFVHWYTPVPPTQMETIKKRGHITIITRNNANCYFMYRDRYMGFEYELARAFAEFLGVGLQIRTQNSWEGMIPALISGEGDVIAASLTRTLRRRRQVLFSDGYLQIRQHIIVHRKKERDQGSKPLEGLEIHVRKGTSYQERLLELLGGEANFTLHLIEDIPTEELIRMVAEKRIEATIADSNIALLNRRYYPSTVIAEAISDNQQLAWAVAPGADALCNEINRFFTIMKESGRLKKLYNRYYSDVDVFNYLDLRAFHRRIRRRLPQYKETIVREAEASGLDWRLVVAQVYQESHMIPDAESPSGAIGLMQILPRTGESLGAENLFDPEENIRTGVRYLKALYDHYDRSAGADRLEIALAAYNVGQGHIYDARNLARSLGLDPDTWSALARTLPMLQYGKFYKDAKYGYCRGSEPVRYVRQIMIYFDILRRWDIRYVQRCEPAAEGSDRS